MKNMLITYSNRVLSLFLLCTFCYITILANDDVIYEEKDYRTSHWSLGVQGGLSFLDGDISQHEKELITFFSNPDLEWNVGVYGEYSINPLVGLGLEYRYTRMGQTNTAMQSGGDMHELTPYASISLNKLLTMSARQFKWNLLFKLGMGLGYYQISTESLNGTVAEKVTYGNLKGISLMLPLGFGYEYNVSENWAIGAYYDYRYSLATDLLDAKMAGTSNDGLHEVTVGVRYKFKAKKYPHNKNISWRLYRNKQLMRDVAEGDADELQMAALRLGAIKKDTLYIMESHKDTLYMVSNNYIKEAVVPQMQYSVYFATGKSDLQSSGLIDIAHVAEEMIENENLVVHVHPYYDRSGSKEFNLKLGRERAERVKYELIYVWGIDASRIKTYEAKVLLTKDDKIHYQPFRRCDLILEDTAKEKE